MIKEDGLEVLTLCTLWMALKGEETNISEGAYAGAVLTLPWNPIAIFRELNQPTLHEQSFVEFHNTSRGAYDRWRAHYDSILRDKGSLGDAIESFDFSVFPFQDDTGLELYEHLNDTTGYNLPLTGKAIDAGYYTHWEDIPINTPLTRHFIMRMLHFNKSGTHGQRGAQRYNLWRRLKKLLPPGSVEVNYLGVELTEDTCWVQLTPMERFNIMVSAFRLAMSESSNMAQHILDIYENEIEFTVPRLTDKPYCPLRPFYENKSFKYWLVYWNGIDQSYVYKQAIGLEAEDSVELVADVSKDELLTSIETDDVVLEEILEELQKVIELTRKKMARKRNRDKRNMHEEIYPIKRQERASAKRSKEKLAELRVEYNVFNEDEEYAEEPVHKYTREERAAMRLAKKEEEVN